MCANSNSQNECKPYCVPQSIYNFNPKSIQMIIHKHKIYNSNSEFILYLGEMIFKRLLPYLIPNYKVYMCFQISKIPKKKIQSIKCADEVLYIPMLQQKYPSNGIWLCVVQCIHSEMQRRSNEVRFKKIFFEDFSRIKMKSHFRYDEGNVQK